MCTVTIVPQRDGFRLACNRDERRTRAAAAEPRVCDAGPCRAIFPLDPQGGGTWIGVNDAGLALALLNRTDDPAAGTSGLCSRGIIILPLLRYDDLDAAIRAAAGVPAARFPPFRLVMAFERRWGVVASDGLTLSVHVSGLRAPVMFTSSSLGDACVEAPRRRLFERLVLGDRRGWLHGQRRFHAHRWSDLPDISVVMTRADARTVSRTVVDATRSNVRLSYEPLEDGPAAEAVGTEEVRRTRSRTVRQLARAWPRRVDVA